jgi:hypothetical protein
MHIEGYDRGNFLEGLAIDFSNLTRMQTSEIFSSLHTGCVN